MSKLSEYREKLNLTQDELAEKAGISVRTIQRIESGAKPKGHTLRTLSEVLKISENDLRENKLELNSSILKLSKS
jgi:transcriptional regulator with XRE-family HTH domain